MTKNTFFVRQRHTKGFLGMPNTFRTLQWWLTLLCIQSFHLKKKKSVGIITDPPVSNLQPTVISYTKYSQHSAIKYSGMLILGRKTCNATWMAFLTQRVSTLVHKVLQDGLEYNF